MEPREVAAQEEQTSASRDTPQDPARLNLPVRRSPTYSAPLCQFDSWVWVQLAQARKQSDHPLSDTWERLRAASNAGRLQVALSSGNYLELWHRVGTASRVEVARTMAELTGYATLKAVHQVLDEEVRLLVGARRTHGRDKLPDRIPREWILANGASHAFGSPVGRLRFVSRLRTTTDDEGESVDTPPEWLALQQKLSIDEFEWINLAGFADDHCTHGIEYRPSHRDGDDWADDQQKVRELVAHIDSDESLLYRMLVYQRLSATFDQVTTVSEPDPEVMSWFNGPVAGAAFINALPSQHVLLELLFAAHRNLNYTFRQHDRVDLMDLALSIPYCDIVVPDAHWAHLANSSRLAFEHGTQVLKGREALRLWSETL